MPGVAAARLPARRRVPRRRHVELDDPYRFLPTLGELDLHLAAEGRHERLYEKLGAHVREIDGVAGTAFAVWAPNARARSASSATSTAGTGGCTRCARWARRGIWELFVPGVGAGDALQVRDPHARTGELQPEGRPVRLATECRRETASVVHDPPHEWDDAEWIERRARSTRWHEPMSIYEVHLGSWRRDPTSPSAAQLPRARRRSSAEYVQRHGLHARRAAAGHGAPVRRLVGLPGDGLLRAHAALRHAGGLPRFVDTLHQHGHRRDPRLGARALPARRVRRSRASTARASTSTRTRAGRAPRLGHAHLQLRPQRGAELPARQRAVLAARVPHRRAARRRRGLDALPRLLARGGRVDAQRATAAARTSRRSRSCASSTTVVHAAQPGVHHDRRGVDRVAGRLAADLPRRARLRLQVEHGLDARHAALLRSSDPVHRALPPRRADVPR